MVLDGLVSRALHNQVGVWCVCEAADHGRCIWQAGQDRARHADTAAWHDHGCKANVRAMRQTLHDGRANGSQADEGYVEHAGLLGLRQIRKDNNGKRPA